MSNLIRFEMNGPAVIGAAIFTTGLVSIFMISKSENRKKCIELRKLENELRIIHANSGLEK